MLLNYTSILRFIFFFSVLLFYKERYDYSTTTTEAAETTPKCIRNVICVCVWLAVAVSSRTVTTYHTYLQFYMHRSRLIHINTLFLLLRSQFFPIDNASARRAAEEAAAQQHQQIEVVIDLK